MGVDAGKSIGVGRKIYGADHWKVAKLKSYTAVLLIEAGDISEARRLLQEARQVLLPLHKPRDKVSSIDMYNNDVGRRFMN